MSKRFLLVIICIFSIVTLPVVVFAVDSDIVCSNICFVDADDNTVTSISDQAITAKAEITKNTSGKKPVILVCSYENEMLNGVWYSSASNLTGEISVTFTPVTVSDSTVIKATVLESLETLGSPSVTANILEDSIDLSRILINQEILEEYSDEVNVYQKQVPNNTEIKIDAIPKDAGTKVEVENISSLPGIAKVKLTSPTGLERNISIVLYSDVEQLSKPINISYKIGDISYNIQNFDPQVTDYTVKLPDNTFYVTVVPEVLSVTNASVKVLDIDHSTKTYDGVSYVSGTLSSLYKTIYNARPSIDNLIPIKNEATKAVIRTAYGDKAVTYNITFESRQPRLTSFDVCDGVKQSDTYHPIFIGGAAANNDNASTAGTDRGWAVTNFSDQLVGSSMFLMDLRANDSDQVGKGNEWYLINKQGEYFSFTADTAGTLYLLSRNNEIKNAEFDFAEGEFEADGRWRKLSSPSKNFIPEGYTSWADVPRTYGSFGDDIYYARMIQYSNTAKFDDGALTANTGTLSLGSYIYTYARTFEEGERVSVYHRGSVASCYIGLIKWDLD